jgi:hypothetical protein
MAYNPDCVWTPTIMQNNSSNSVGGLPSTERKVEPPMMSLDGRGKPRPRREPNATRVKNRKALRTTGKTPPQPIDEFRFQMDKRGKQHFNFNQEIWLDPTVQMAHAPVYTTALKTLAVNLLTLTINKRDRRAAVGITSRTAISLAPSFCRQCLMGAPGKAWALPRATIEAWLESKRRRRSSRSRRI